MFTHRGLGIHVCCLNKLAFFHEVQKVRGRKFPTILGATLRWSVPEPCLMEVLCSWYRKSGLPRSEGAFRIHSSRLAALKLWKPWQLQLRPGLLRFMDSLVQSRHSKPAKLCFNPWLVLEPRTPEILQLTWAVHIVVDLISPHTVRLSQG